MLFENIKESLNSIRCNKMRSLLTMLGIIIGISAVITITTIGNSLRRTLSTTFNSLGANALYMYIMARYPESEEDYLNWEYPEMDKEDYVTDEDIEKIKELYPDAIEGIAVNNFLGAGKVSDSSDNYAKVAVQGCTKDYLKYMKVDIKLGRNITDADNKKCKVSCVVADKMASNYFKDENPIGKNIEIDMGDTGIFTFVIVGVYKYNPQMQGGSDEKNVPEKDRITPIYTSYNTVSKLNKEDNYGYENFTIILNPSSNIKDSSANVKLYFDEKYADNKDFQIESFDAASELEMIDNIINIVTIAISAIAAISLIVGGVGVMNIMLVSITERTKEIGIRMALGAKRKTIRVQFLIEAVIICLIGGLIGVTIGIVNGYLLGGIVKMAVQSAYEEYASYIIFNVQPSLTAINISLFFSMLTGVFFGYYPANKAAKMEVIDALRYE
ncbi:MAG: ABC transporter permease [Lachnospiraceae bacterium]|nr:ABC transporter permease [Lachnospiraceae bacterium]